MIKEMSNFNYYNPTKIYFRPDGVDLIGKIIKNDYGFKTVYLVYGSSALKNKVVDKVTLSLKAEEVEFKEYTGILPNPDIEDVLKMKEECLKLKPELIIALGGGSIMDACKLLANLYFYTGNPLDFNKHVVLPLHALPVCTIPTIAASGSEMSSSCVISSRETGFKNGFNSHTNYPLFSLVDPTLTYSVNSKQTSYGLVDMFSHSFERYFSLSNELEPSDMLALSAMKQIVDLSKTVLDNPHDYQARRAVMILSTISHNGFTDFGKTKKFIIHAAEHYLSGKYPTLAHGQGIALLLTEFIKINKSNKDIYDKAIKLGEFIFNADSFEKTISKIDFWLNSLDIINDIKLLPEKITDEDIKKAYKYLKV